MRRFVLSAFGLANLKLEESAAPTPGPGEVRVDLRAMSLNFRDLMVIEGVYNAKLRLPVTPISDGAGVVSAVGAGVTDWKLGDQVMGVFSPDWRDGPYRMEQLKTTLGTPGPGWASEQVVLPGHALLRIPQGYDFMQAATLPIAAVTAWSALQAGGAAAGSTVLTLGTGGVAIFTLQIAKALGCKVFITSSSDEKLARARELGADVRINYRSTPKWEDAVVEQTGGLGVDVTVETGGGGTLNQSLTATRAGGTVSLLGALTGLNAQVNAGAVIMKQIRIAGIMVGSRAGFEKLIGFLTTRKISPVIDRRYAFEQLPEALAAMKAAGHLGKIVIKS